MARQTWNMESYDTGSWLADGTIYRPNENLSLDIMSTQARISLADGSRAYATPETKYTREPLTFRWLELDDADAFMTKVKNYVTNQNYVRITDHLGFTYTGRFVTIRQVWLSGIDDTFDIECVFEVMVN